VVGSRLHRLPQVRAAYTEQLQSLSTTSGIVFAERRPSQPRRPCAAPPHTGFPLCERLRCCDCE